MKENYFDKNWLRDFLREEAKKHRVEELRKCRTFKPAHTRRNSRTRTTEGYTKPISRIC
jgi:hypothetical protein